MNLDLEELKKNHNTSYLAGILERLNREEGRCGRCSIVMKVYTNSFQKLKSIRKKKKE